MWFAARGGISVYDGAEWKSYAVADGLPSLSFFKNKKDEQGTIWTLPYPPTISVSYCNGTKRVTLPKPVSKDEPDNFTSFEITFINNQRHIAVGTSNMRLFLYRNKQWQQITPANGLLSDQVNAIAACNKQFYVAGVSLLLKRIVLIIV